MAIGYIQGSGEDFVGGAPPAIIDDDSTGWWGGVQLCFAAVAIAVGLTSTALATQVAINVAKDVEEIPAGSLFLSSIHEAVPQYRQYNQQPRMPLVRYMGQADELPTPATFTEEEEYWQNPTPPVPPRQYVALPYLPDTEEIPAGSLFGQPDEDHWQNWVRPVPQTMLWAQQWTFDEQIPVGSLFGQPDEDFWLNWVRPSVRMLQPPQQWTFDTQEPAGSLFGQDDEDYWINPVPPRTRDLKWPQQSAFDQQEPAGSLYGVAEDEPWRNPVVPIAPTIYQRLPYLYDAGEIAYAPLTIAEEEYWTNPVASVAARQYLAPVFIDGDEVPVFVPQVDEDYWINPTRAIAASLYQALPIFFDNDDALPAVGPIDDEPWTNPVWPTPARMYQPLPIGDRDDTWQFVFVPPVEPTATLSANPTTIVLGHSSTLTWTTTDATSVEILGVGTFGPNGSVNVTPNATTIYHLIATGTGGTADAFATVTITRPTTTPVSEAGPTLPAPVFRPIQPVEEIDTDTGGGGFRPVQPTEEHE